jgi:hypothetical protein
MQSVHSSGSHFSIQHSHFSLLTVHYVVGTEAITNSYFGAGTQWCYSLQVVAREKRNLPFSSRLTGNSPERE